MKTTNSPSREIGFRILEQKPFAVVNGETGECSFIGSTRDEGLDEIQAYISSNWYELRKKLTKDVTITFTDTTGRIFHIYPGSGTGEELYLISCQPDKYVAGINDLFEKNVAGSYEISHQGKVLKCNKSFASILAIDDPQELLGKNIEEFYLNPSLRNTFLSKIEQEGALRNYEILLLRSDGKVAWCIENSYLVQYDGGEKSIVGTIVEITEEKLAREKYSQLFTESMDAILIFDSDKVVDCNKRTEEIFRSTREALLGISVKEMIKNFVDEDSRKIDLLDHKVKRLIRGEKQHIRLNMRRNDATKFHAELFMAPFQVLGQHYVQIIIHDVSERVLFENAIRESEERFRLISKVAIEGVVFTDEGKIVDCNEQFIRMLGFRDRKDVLGNPLTEYISSEDLGRLRINMEMNRVVRMEFRTRNVLGEIMVLEASGTRIIYQDKSLEAYLLYDITSRKRTEQALEQSKDRFKGLVENLPNGVFILTDGLIKYANYSALTMLGFQDEDDIYDIPFIDFFATPYKSIVEADLDSIREGEEVDYRELEIIDRLADKIDIGIRFVLTVYDNKPSIQITVNNLQAERLLVQEKLRVQMAEEINSILKKEIAEHKETQQKLEEARTFTKNIIESSLDMIIAVDRGNRITEFNRAASEFFGYSQDEVIGKDVSILYSSEKDFRHVQQLLAKSGFFTGELLNRKKSGEVFTSYLSASILRNNQDEVLGSMGVCRDITEIKRAEMELRASEERYRDIFENTRDFIFSIDRKGCFIYVNNAFCEATGYSSTELQGLNIRELCVEPHMPKNRSIFSVFDENSKQTVWRCRDGEMVIAKGDVSISYQGNNPHSLRGILRNVTQEEEQKARLDSIFDSTENMLMWTVDENISITSSNKNFRNVFTNNFGINIAEGSNFIDELRPILNLDLYQGQMDNYHEAFQGRPRQFELPLLDKKGSKVWLQLFLNPVHYGGNLEEVSCIAYDITDRKEFDRRIRDALKEKEVLLQEVHHRVKNNLQVISSILNLQSGYVEDPRTLEILKESQNRIRSMSFIHETLYQTADFSSIEFADYISTLTRNLIHSYTTDRPVQLETDFDEVNLGIDQAIPCGLIVNELVSNALKYAYDGVERPCLSVSIKERGREIKLRVKDNGRGFPKDFRYEESNSLGIQLVYTLVDQLDATIELKSEGGADIIITFERV
jgi:PAS domain S-box-containing protein